MVLLMISASSVSLALPQPEITSKQIVFFAKRHYAQYGDDNKPSSSQSCDNALYRAKTAPNYVELRAECIAEMDAYQLERRAALIKKDAEENAAFPILLLTALKVSFDEGTVDGACQMAYESLKYPRGAQELQITRCQTELKSAYAEEFTSGKRAPRNCSQWAIAKGGEWANATINMRYSPLLTTRVPVSFWGRVDDAQPSQLVVNGDEGNAVVVINKSTIVFRPERIRIGGNAFGFGTHTGKLPVKLVSGAQTTIPIITASCVQ